MIASLALRMALHDRQPTLAAIFGVAFAFLLAGQQTCAVMHYLEQGAAYVDSAGADLWIVPPGEMAFFVGSSLLPSSSLHTARSATGVRWAEPIVRGSAWVRLPNGGARTVLLVGTAAPTLRGGPFSIVRGEGALLLNPNAIFVEDGQREKLGGLNIGSTVELNGTQARVEGFMWGAMSLAGSYVFSEYDFAREILGVDSDRVSCVIVGVEDRRDLPRIQQQLQSSLPEATVLTTEQYITKTNQFILYEFGTGAVLVMGICISLIVGLGIVTLSMVSAVERNIREFATLKAMGATNGDLRLVLLLQALGYSTIGSIVGAGVLCQLAWAARTPQIILIVPAWLLAGLVVFVALIALTSAMVALRGVQRVEPASVFR